MSDLDILIIGAGAAGIAAGRRLAKSAASFLIVEAAERIGGRAQTIVAAGMPLDLGCGWLHSADRNSWAALAEKGGIAIDRTPPAWGEQYQDLGFPREEQAEARAAFEAFDRRLREAPPASDRASDALDLHCPWNAYLEALSGYINGAELECLSVADYLAYADADSGVNWRLPAGYGAVIAAMGAGLPIRLRTPVASVDRSGPFLRADTPDGPIGARAAIVAVPTSILAEERLVFTPALPRKVEAAARLPLGLANKLFLALEDAEELEPDTQLVGNPRHGETGSYYIRPFRRPVIEAFYGGFGARGLEEAGREATVDFALQELRDLFGSAFPTRLRPLPLSAWGRERYAGGSYSHALPGYTAARAALAEPVEGRIFFAGEACSTQDFSTAHGAHDSGVRAAEEALEALGY